jgi:hypothetical protein
MYVQQNIGSCTHLTRRPVVTIALLPRRANAIGRFARFSLASRDTAPHHAPPQPATTQAINAGRWATLPGEYSGPSARPLDQALPAITTAGVSVPVACAGFGPVTMHLAGIWNGRIAFEGSMDGVRWSPITLASFDGGMESATTDRPGLWRTLPTQSVAFIRLRVVHLSAGTILSAVAAAPILYHVAHDALDSAA